MYVLVWVVPGGYVVGFLRDPRLEWRCFFSFGASVYSLSFAIRPVMYNSTEYFSWINLGYKVCACMDSRSSTGNVVGSGGVTWPPQAPGYLASSHFLHHVIIPSFLGELKY